MLFRFSAGIAASDFLAEGGFGSSHKGSWLVSARKSYINYLVHGRVTSYSDVGFEDADVNLNYDLTPRQSLIFFAVSGPTTLNQTDVAALAATPDATLRYATGKSSFTLLRAGWHWAATPDLLVAARGAYIRQTDELSNPFHQILNKNLYREWMGAGSVSWAWGKGEILQAGWTRRLQGDNRSFAEFNQDLQLADLRQVHGTGVHQGGYMQQTASIWGGRVHALGSLRWDSLEQIGSHPSSPQLSLAVRAAATTQLQFAAGRYAQFPDFLNVVENQCGQIGFLPERSNHFSAAVEQRLGDLTRVRLEVFDRQNAFAIGAVPHWTALDGAFGPCRPWQPLAGPGTFQRDYSRGAQLVLQRRSANRLSGWVGYTLVQARERTYAVYVPNLYLPFGPRGSSTLFKNSTYFPTLEDQRHSVNAFAMYRLKPSVNLSGKLLYGSGFPVPSGTFIQIGQSFEPVDSNTARLGTYFRTDFRVDKDWAFTRWKLTLYAEVLNLTDHDNRRYYATGAINPNTGQTAVTTLEGLPVTPTAGLVFHF